MCIFRHQHEGSKGRHHHHDGHSTSSNMSKLPLIRSLAEIGRNHSSSKSESVSLAHNFNHFIQHVRHPA